MKKINPNGSKTLYVGGIYEVDKASGGAVTRTVTYYPVAGAMRINSTLYYVLKDHLGSASVVTDASGNILGEQRYYPFGETRLTSGTIYTDKLFTGQREITGLGIYHYGARFYSPKLGRFLSPDTIVPNPYNPQDLNRFSYVRNNPLRYIDPTGHESVCGYDYSDPECESPQDAPVVINNPGPLDPGLPQGGGGGGGSGGNNNNNGNNGGNSGGGGNSGCNGIPDCGLNDEVGPLLLPYVPLDDGLIVPTGCSNCITPGHHPESTPNPVISILGVATLLVLAVPETLITFGIISIAMTGGPIGWVVDALVLIPLDLAMFNLSIYAAQMAATGSTDHDVLPLWPGDQ